MTSNREPLCVLYNPRVDLATALNCPNCGYDLRASAEGLCPECGQFFDRDKLQQSQIPWSHR